MTSMWGKALLAIALIAAGWLGFGSVDRASAYYGGYHTQTIYHVKTIYKHKYVTRYYNRYRTVYVPHYRRIVYVTRIRPVIYVHNVYRIHYRPVAVWHTKVIHVTKYLPARVYSSNSYVRVPYHSHAPHY